MLRHTFKVKPLIQQPAALSSSVHSSNLSSILGNMPLNFADESLLRLFLCNDEAIFSLLSHHEVFLSTPVRLHTFSPFIGFS
jgi:hypothetical protein